MGLYLGYAPRQALEHVMMRVHQSWYDSMIRQADDHVC